MVEKYVRSANEPCVVCGDESNPTSLFISAELKMMLADKQPPKDWFLCPKHRYAYNEGKGVIYLIAVEPSVKPDGSINPNILEGVRTGQGAAMPLTLLEKLMTEDIPRNEEGIAVPVLFVHPDVIEELNDLRQAVINVHDRNFNPEKLN